MKAKAVWRRRALCALGAFLVASYNAAVPLRAEGASADTSAWDRADHSGLRLLSGRSTSATPDILAGIEIVLDAGWKTYWRYPGDSGVPPRFDFSASDNVAAATPLYPAPQRFKDGSGTSIGYSERVVFPLMITAKDPSKPVVVRAKVDYAICEKLCVPVEAKAALRLGPTTPATKSAIEANLRRVPRQTEIGTKGPLAIVSANAQAGTPQRIVVDVTVPAGQKVDLLAEGPTADWSLPLPEAIDGAPPGAQRFSFDLDGMPPGVAATGATLTLTAITNDDAIHAPLKLD